MTVNTARGKAENDRTWRFPRLILEDHIALAAMVWAGFMVVVIGIALGIEYFGDLEGSVLSNASSTALWYLAVLTGTVAYQTVPMFVAHGRTRRDTTIELVIFIIMFAAAIALLMTIGYLIEYGVYGIADWPREMSGGDHFFSSHTDLLTIFWEYSLTGLVWAAAGAFVGASFYRYDANGWLALIPAGILVSLAGISFGPTFMGIVLRLLPSTQTNSPLLFTILAIAAFLISIAITWPILRNLPIRNR